MRFVRNFVEITFNRTKTILALYACPTCIKFRKKLSLNKVKMYYDVIRKHYLKRKKYLNFCNVLPSKKIAIGSYFERTLNIVVINFLGLRYLVGFKFCWSFHNK